MVSFMRQVDDTNSAKTLVQLRRRYSRWKRSRKDADLYLLLGKMYDLVCAWRERGYAKDYARACARAAGIRFSASKHSFRILIDCIATEDRRVKSRWDRALRFCWAVRKRYKSFRQCVRRNGGIAGCATGWADLQSYKRTPPCYVRVGGEDPVCPVPLFVPASAVNGYDRGDSNVTKRSS
jgi:hypothetical protein